MRHHLSVRVPAGLPGFYFLRLSLCESEKAGSIPPTRVLDSSAVSAREEAKSEARLREVIEARGDVRVHLERRVIGEDERQQERDQEEAE